MSEAKFTPGPWHANWDEHPVLFPFVWQKGGYAIAKMCGKPKHTDAIVASERDLADPEKVKANAVLIAAAPEMYEFAETTAQVLRLALKTYCLPEPVYRLLKERIDEAEKLTKKARGKE